MANIIESCLHLCWDRKLRDVYRILFVDARIVQVAASFNLAVDVSEDLIDLNVLLEHVV